MAGWLRQAGWALLLIAAVAPCINGEGPFEERPQVKELSREELVHRKAGEKVREAQLRRSAWA